MSVRRVRRVVVQQDRDRARLRRAYPGFLIDAERIRAAPSYGRELGIARSRVFRTRRRGALRAVDRMQISHFKLALITRRGEATCCWSASTQRVHGAST